MADAVETIDVGMIYDLIMRFPEYGDRITDASRLLANYQSTSKLTVLRIIVILIVGSGCAGSVSNQIEDSSSFSPPGPPIKKRAAADSQPDPLRDETSSSRVADPSGNGPNDTTPTRRRSIDEMLLFSPSRYPEGDWTPRDLDFNDITFMSSDGTELHAWYCEVKRPTAHILYMHGNAGNLSHRTEVLRRLTRDVNCSVLIFDYRGYGRSSGVPTVSGALSDARAARKLLASTAAIRESQIVLLGRSLGGAIAVRLASELPARALVVESSFHSMKSIAKHHYPMLAWLVPADRLNSADRIAMFHGPTLISHGDRDRVIPQESGRALFARANQPKTFLSIARVGHNDSQPLHYYTTLQSFLSELPEAETQK